MPIVRRRACAIGLSGALLVVPIAAGGAAPGTQGLLSWVTCAGSPDGCLWQVAPGDGSGERTLQRFADRDAPRTVALAPGGAVVAFAASGKIELRSASSGRPLRSLVRLSGPKDDTALAWNRTATRLAYATPTALWTVAIDGSSPQLLMHRKGVRTLAWSPDGRRVAFVQSSAVGARQELWVARTDGSGRRRLAIDVEISDASWSADGRRIVVALTRRLSDWNHAVYSVDVLTGGRRWLGRGNAPSYSPDGRTVAYLVVRDATPHVRLVVSSLDGRTRRIPVGWDSAFPPVWSPDGRELVGHGEFELEAVRVDGRGRRTLASTWVDVSDLDWQSRH